MIKPRDFRRRPGAAPPARAAFFTGLRAVIVAVVVIGVLFAAYDVVERTWLRSLTTAQLYNLHRLRGILAAAIAASVASWLILRAPPLFPEGGSPARLRSPAVPISGQERDRRFAEWFIQMRWIALVIALVLVLVSVQVTGYLGPERMPPLLSIIGALALMNIAYEAALRSTFPTRPLLLAQAYGDLLVLTALLHFSGGVENPLGILMLFHVLIAGIVLSRRQCYLVAAGASVLFAAMAWGEYSGALHHYTLTIFPHVVEGGEHLHAALEGRFVASRVALQTVVLFLTGYFTSTVTRQLQRRERQLEALAEQALAQSQLLERSLDSTGTALCVCDANLKPTWVNPRWGQFFGVATGASLPAAVDPSARETLKDGGVHVGEVVLRGDRDGSTVGATRAEVQRTILLTTAPLLGKDGRVTHVVELARDVTRLRGIQERIGRAEQLAAVGELAGKVAHEVNNPIAVISAKARLLLSRNRDELSEHTASELAKITELADKVAHIARGLLSYARPGHGPASPTDVRLAVVRALSMIEAAAGAARVEVSERLPDTLPLVRANAVEMEQVFVNLFMNALDAMPTGGRLTVRSEVEPAQGPQQRPAAGSPLAPDAPSEHLAAAWLTVVVEDTGVGIPHELQAQVFEPFVSTKAEGKGTGLGLAVCLGLVRSHGGAIELDSEPGRGTRIYVRLPVPEPVMAEASSDA